MAKIEKKTDPSLPLTDARRERFCLAWIPHHNGAQAAITAGYSPHSARVQAARLLTQANVRARVAFLDEKIINGLEISAKTTIRELAKIAHANIDDYVTVQEDGSATLDLAKTTRDQRAAIQEITVEEYVDGRGKGARQVKRVRMKLHDKRGPLSDLAKHFGLFEADNRQKGGLEAFLAFLAERARGLPGAGTGGNLTDAVPVESVQVVPSALPAVPEEAER